MTLYTKNGVPLQQHGNNVYSRSGAFVGTIQNNRVFDRGGRYVGTILNNRLVYRPSERSFSGSSSSAGRISGTSLANSSGVGISGEEPDIPD